jgi:hypothetical protein
MEEEKAKGEGEEGTFDGEVDVLEEHKVAHVLALKGEHLFDRKILK